MLYDIQKQHDGTRSQKAAKNSYSFSTFDCILHNCSIAAIAGAEKEILCNISAWSRIPKGLRSILCATLKNWWRSDTELAKKERPKRPKEREGIDFNRRDRKQEFLRIHLVIRQILWALHKQDWKEERDCSNDMWSCVDLHAARSQARSEHLSLDEIMRNKS